MEVVTVRRRFVVCFWLTLSPGFVIASLTHSVLVETLKLCFADSAFNSLSSKYIIAVELSNDLDPRYDLQF
jgi:hypothetical protein